MVVRGRGLSVAALDNVVEETGDGERADSADDWSDGGEVGARVELGGEVAFNDAVFAGGASIYKSGARGNKIARNQPRSTRCTYYYIKVLKVCQVATAVEQGNIVMRASENAVERGADQFAAADNGNFLICQFNIVAS